MDVIVEVDEFTADVPVPEDAIDGIDATTVAQGLQALANRTKYVHDRSGDVYLLGDTYGTIDSTTAAAFGTDDTLLFGAIADVVDGDKVLVDYSAIVNSTTGAAAAAEVAIGYSLDGGSTITTILHSVRQWTAMTNGVSLPFQTMGFFEVSGLGSGVSHDLELYVRIRSDGTNTFTLLGPWSSRVRICKTVEWNVTA